MRLPDRRVIFLIALSVVLVSATAIRADDTGFDLGGALVPKDEIHLGGPSRDGIPALDHPKFVASGKASFLDGKDQVPGLVRNGEAKAYPFAELSRAGKREIRDQLSGRELRVEFDWANESARVFDDTGKQLPAVTSFWFAWYAFHPDTEVFTAKGR